MFLQLSHGISTDLQKLLQYFNGTAAISTFFLLSVSGVFYVNLILDLNDSDSVILTFGSSFIILP